MGDNDRLDKFELTSGNNTILSAECMSLEEVKVFRWNDEGAYLLNSVASPDSKELEDELSKIMMEMSVNEEKDDEDRTAAHTSRQRSLDR